MKNNLWKPRDFEEYWYVKVTNESKDDAWTYHWHNDSVDKSHYAFGNVFKSKKLALAARDKVKQLLLTLKHK